MFKKFLDDNISWMVGCMKMIICEILYFFHKHNAMILHWPQFLWWLQVKFLFSLINLAKVRINTYLNFRWGFGIMFYYLYLLQASSSLWMVYGRKAHFVTTGGKRPIRCTDNLGTADSVCLRKPMFRESSADLTVFYESSKPLKI